MLFCVKVSFISFKEASFDRHFKCCSNPIHNKPDCRNHIWHVRNTEYEQSV